MWSSSPSSECRNIAKIMCQATIKHRQETGLIADKRSLLGVNNYAATPQQVSLARHWVRGLLAQRVDDETLFDIAVCAGELLDNARKHGRADGVITASVYMGADTIRLEVMDDGSALTVPHVTESLETEDGRGLKIVATLASRWGRHKDRDLNQIVWCEFSVPKERDEEK
jgi:anti-sigma regulatory factor (Ser/Thr protein kinase)